ncbi:sugar-transfer associated ATP-grasp domain-containing protein [Parahaliea aestuarii]|uniref:Alpha-L-glutamate ligase-related protein ATP-grasp domain-containing protein n=1 Tax=Parahaliea aestuarii TaxID=1852021 RepID=A0A5C8ZME4_9GAMM|nr:sugar-transfer associated ATP-grasp domain-containing protein [Parahaliea aestuarii]TXS89643.1 hypothetical protein FVW59_16635 [Parahaliea aestuarii]
MTTRRIDGSPGTGLRWWYRFAYAVLQRTRLLSQWLQGLPEHCRQCDPLRSPLTFLARIYGQGRLLREGAISARDYYHLGLHKAGDGAAYTGSWARWQWLEPINPESERARIEDKLWLNRHLAARGIPCTDILAAFGDFDPLGMRQFPVFDEEARHWLQSLVAPVFLKPRFGGKADGIFRCDPQRGELHWRSGDGGDSGAAGAAEQALAALVARGYIAETGVTGHQSLAALNPASLNTIRIFTVYLDGAKILMASLRIGRGDSIVDNVSRGGLSAPIDLASGRLGRAATVDTRGAVQRFPQHPLSGAAIEGSVIPCWTQVMDLVSSAAELLTGADILAWDVAVTDSGPLVIECNSYWESMGIQLAHGAGLKTGLFCDYLRSRKMSTQLGLLHRYSGAARKVRSLP